MGTDDTYKNTHCSFKKLNGDNYSSWAHHCRNLLTITKAWEIVKDSEEYKRQYVDDEGNVRDPTDEEQALIRNWTDRRHLAASHIYASCTEEVGDPG